MFCHNCGKEIAESSMYCNYCGAQQKQLVSIARNIPAGETDLERELLKVHLRDVLTMECFLSRMNMRSEKLHQELIQEESDNLHKEFSGDIIIPGLLSSTTKRYSFEFFYNGTEIFLKTSTQYRLPTYSTYFGYGFAWLPFSQLNLNRDSFWPQDLCRYGSSLAASLRRRELIPKLKERLQSCYQEFSQLAPEAYKQNAMYIEAKRAKYVKVLREKTALENLLQKTYAVNLIPDPFRHNLYALFYFQRYLETSKLSFENALLHYDINEIKTKLDRIIDQQQTIIIQQAVRIAQNYELCKQNERKLDALKRIEVNTENASKAAKIAADNAELNAWINAATYLKLK